MAFTFTTLKTAIQDYTENAEATFVTQLPRFILNAEDPDFDELSYHQKHLLLLHNLCFLPYF